MNCAPQRALSINARGWDVATVAGMAPIPAEGSRDRSLDPEEGFGRFSKVGRIHW